MTLKYKVENQILHAVGDMRPTIELSRNVVYLDLAFDEEWDGATVTVVFENSSLPDAEPVARLWTGDAVEVPPEVLVNGDLRIGCIGLKADGIRLTTERMKSGIYICRAGGAMLLANGAAEMTPELWEQCIAAAGAANEAAKDATAAKDDLLAARDSGEFDGKDGKNATIEIGTVETADEDAEASVINSGTDTAAVLNFVLPRGKQGPEGPAGKNGTSPAISLSRVEENGRTGVQIAAINDGSDAPQTMVVYDGENGEPGEAGQDGSDGGYYSPAVTQPDANTMRVSFTPSKADMPAVQDTDITIPSGGSGSVAVDSTLTVSGQAADAKAVGDAISNLSEEIANFTAIDDGGGNVIVNPEEGAAEALSYEVIHGGLSVLDGLITYEGATNTAKVRACMNPLLIPIDAVNEEKTVRYTIPDGYMCGPTGYMVDDPTTDFSVVSGTGKTFTGTRVLDPGWQTGTYDFVVSGANMFGVTIKRADGGIVTDADIATLNEGFKVEVDGVGSADEVEMTSLRFGSGSKYLPRDNTKVSKSGWNADKYLGTDANGNVVEKDAPSGGEVTDEQVSTAVSAWLGEHPEATTTVEDGSITEAKLADGAVSERKTKYLSYVGTDKNLFDKSVVTDGVKRYSGSPWNLIEDETYCLSGFIPVEPNTVYCRSAKSFEPTGTTVEYQHTFFADADKNFLSSIRHYYGSKSFTTPENCAYIQLNLPIECKDIAMVVRGASEPSDYVPYKEFFKLGNGILIGVDNFESLQDLWNKIPDASIRKSALSSEVAGELDSVNHRVNIASQWNDVRQPTKKLTGRINVFEHTVKGVFDIASDISDKTIVVHGVNYFDLNDMVPGTMADATGEISETENGFYTKHLVPVQPGKILFWSRAYKTNITENGYLRFHLYDKDQNWIGIYGIGGVSYNGSYTVPENVFFMRIYEANQGGTVTDLIDEKLQIADVNIGNPYYGYGGNVAISGGTSLYFGETVYFPYIGYRIENGVLEGASDTFTVEEITHVDVLDAESTIEVTAPIEEFDQNKLKNVALKYGRHGGTDYVMARIFKNTVDGGRITPKVIASTPGGITMKNYASENDFVFAINAGIFNTDDNSCLGTTISNGVVITDHVTPNLSGAGDTLGVDSNGDFVSIAYDTTTQDMLANGITQTVQGWATIISNYAKSDLDALKEVLYPSDGTYGTDYIVTAKHPRTACGQYANGDYMVFLCGGRQTNQAGMTLAEMQELFVDEGVKFAYNLDGGGSCNGYFYKRETAPYTENRADPSYIVFD